MLAKHGILGALLIPLFIGAVFGLFSGVSHWVGFLNDHSAPTYEQVRDRFGEPDQDIGSGIHIDVYREKVGEARVGHTGPGPVFYVDYCVKFCKRLYLREQI